MPKLSRDDLKDFAIRLAQIKTEAGELGLWETMQALEPPLRKAGYEIAAKKQAASTLRADAEFDKRTHSFQGFRVRRVSDNFVLFWGSGLISTISPAKEWKELLKFLKQHPHKKFIVGTTVKQFVKKNRNLEWAKDGTIQKRKK